MQESRESNIYSLYIFLEVAFSYHMKIKAFVKNKTEVIFYMPCNIIKFVNFPLNHLITIYIK